MKSISLDKVLRRSVDDNAWDEESDEVWRGMDRATVQSATLVDLTTADSCPAVPSPVEEGRDLLRRIASMPRQLSKAVRDDI